MTDLVQPGRNRERAARIDRLSVVYWSLLGDPEEGAQTDPSVLASIMADMRHWCDANGEDFQHMVELSELHYLSETEGGE